MGPNLLYSKFSGVDKQKKWCVTLQPNLWSETDSWAPTGILMAVELSSNFSKSSFSWFLINNLHVPGLQMFPPTMLMKWARWSRITVWIPSNTKQKPSLLPVCNRNLVYWESQWLPIFKARKDCHASTHMASLPPNVLSTLPIVVCLWKLSF